MQAADCSECPCRLQQSYRCDRCQRTFRSREPYVDLTMQAGIEQEAYKQTFWGGTEIFRHALW